MKLASCSLALVLTLGGCANQPAPAPQDAFWQALASHCGQAYAGRLVTDEAPDAAMRGVAMTMQVQECSDRRIAVPFHVERPDGSWDRSRTWVFTRTTAGLRLKHDHRHADGTPDGLTQYGGDTASPGTAAAQDFPVDADSIALFQREGRTGSVTNVWRVELDRAGTPQGRFAYQLLRQPPHARNFRVEFDLTRPIAPPPPAWGH